MIDGSPADAPTSPALPMLASDNRQAPPPAPEADAFGELGPVLGLAFLLWILVSTAVAFAG